jgi:hypothetical protein
MTSEDKRWNPWLVKEVYPSDLLVDKFLSWDSNAVKPRLKAWHRAQKWVSDIIRRPFTPPTGHTLRVSDKENAFLYMTEEMSKNVPFTDFLRSCMIPPTNDLGLDSIATQNVTNDASEAQEEIKSEAKIENDKKEAITSNVSINDKVTKICKSTWSGTECQISECAKVHIKPCLDRECYAQYDGLPLWKRRKCQLWHVRTKSKKKKSNDTHIQKKNGEKNCQPASQQSRGNGAKSFPRAVKNGHSNSHQSSKRYGTTHFPNANNNGHSNTNHSRQNGSTYFRKAAGNDHFSTGVRKKKAQQQRNLFESPRLNYGPAPFHQTNEIGYPKPRSYSAVAAGNAKAVPAYQPLIRDGDLSHHWGVPMNQQLEQLVLKVLQRNQLI